MNIVVFQAAVRLYVVGAACAQSEYLWVQEEGAVVFHFARKLLGGYNAFGGY